MIYYKNQKKSICSNSVSKEQTSLFDILAIGGLNQPQSKTMIFINAFPAPVPPYLNNKFTI